MNKKRLQDWAVNDLERLLRDLKNFFRGRSVRDGNDAEELAQKVVFKGLEQGELDAPRAFLFGIARNEFKTYFRERIRRQRLLGEQIPLDQVAGGDDPLDLSIRNELKTIVGKGMDQLPHSTARYVDLYLSGECFAEIARLVNVPEQVVRRAIGRGLKQLRPLLVDYGDVGQ